MSERIINDMNGGNLEAHPYTNITNVQKLGDKEYLVDLSVNGTHKQINVNTILLAVGRTPNSSVVNKTFVDIDEDSNKI